MAPNSNTKLLKVALVLFILIALFYGFIYLFFPQLNVEASGGDPVPSGWLRWMGGIIFALGICGIMVLRKPRHQGIFVTSLALGSLISGLALLYSAFFEPEGIGNLSHTYIPGIVQLVLSVLLWLGLVQSKSILFN